MGTILSRDQREILIALGQESLIRDSFYLTGGTALAEYYLHHRLSEDLDFFSEQEVDTTAISVMLKKMQRRVPVAHVEFEQSFNRNLFFLHLKNKSIIKTEFTFFPFPRVEAGIKKDGILIDSLVDIAVNKLFTIYQKPRARDYIDLYCIIKKERWPIVDLIKKARIKFDWHIDFVQLGAQFLQVTEVKDYPRMIKNIDHTTWQNFFLREAKKFSKKILK